jgi:hypothetical protein
LLAAFARLAPDDFWNVFDLLGARAVGCRATDGLEAGAWRFATEGPVLIDGRDPAEGRAPEGLRAGSAATPAPEDCRVSIF